MIFESQTGHNSHERQAVVPDSLESKNIFNLDQEQEAQVIPKLAQELEKMNRNTQELQSLNDSVHEMSPKAASLKSEVLEIDSLSVRGEIFATMRELGVPEDDYEKFIAYVREQNSHYSPEKILSTESQIDQKQYDEVSGAVEKVASIIHDMRARGMTLDNAHSEQWEEEVSIHTETLESLEGFMKSKPNLVLDLILNQNSQFLLEILTNGSFLDNSEISAKKITEQVLPRISENSRAFPSVEGTISIKINKEKLQLINKLPLEESFELITNNPGILSNSWDEQVTAFHKRLGKQFEEILREKNFTKNAEFISRLEQAHIWVYNALPEKLARFNFGEQDVKKILIGKMPYWIADSYGHRFETDPDLGYLLVARDSSYRIHKELSKVSAWLHNSFNQEQFLKILNQEGISFESLTPDAKRTALQALDDDAIANTFSLSDFKQLFAEGGFAIHRIPNEVAPILKQDAINYFFEGQRVINLVNFELFLNKFNGTTDDLNPQQLIECMKDREILEKHGQLFTQKEFGIYLEQATELVMLDYIPNEYKEGLRQSITENARNNLSTLVYGKHTQYFEYLNESDFEQLIRLRYIPKNSIPEQYRDRLTEQLVNKSKKIFTNTHLPDPEAIKDSEIRNKAIESINNPELSKLNEGFKVSEQPELLPKSIQEKMSQFKNVHGLKGERLMGLAVSTYGINDEASFLKRIEKIEAVLNKYNPEAIPKNTKVSLGIEYEVGESIAGNAGQYTKDTGLAYKTSIGVLNAVGDIRSGNDGVHEIATKPTDNPYLLIAEVKLLQEAGMFDFNFSRYPNASRGYHLSLGGERGIYKDDSNTRFMFNALTMTGNTGLLIGKEVSSIKSIHRKSLDEVNGVTYEGDRVEFKGMGCDSIEQFERSVLFMYNSGVATQVEKGLQGSVSEELLSVVPDDFKEFDRFLEQNYPNNDIVTNQEKEILFEWLTCKKQMVQAVKIHNESFIESEFYGTLMTPEGEYKDLELDSNYATKRIRYFGNEKINVSAEQQKYTLKQDLFSDQDTDFINTLTRANNLLIFKEARLNPNKIDSDTGRIKQEWMGNAPQLLTAMQGEGYNKDVPGTPYESIMDKGGEMRDGYYAIQGTSEYMITHRSQIILNRFNQRMQELLSKTSGVTTTSPVSEFAEY